MKNNFISTPFTMSADVANGGTFTVNYPAGYNAGDFSNAAGHYISLNGDKLLQPQHVTLSFGASAVTVTNGTGGTLSAGRKGFFQFELRGESINKQVVSGLNKVQRVHAAELFGVLVDFGAPVAADADGILNDASATDSAQSYNSANFVATFNGKLDVPRNITLTGTSGSNHVITVNGRDEYGENISESITLSGTSTIAGKKAFAEVVSFSVAAGAAGDTFDAGWGDVLGLPVRINKVAQVLQELEAGVVVSQNVAGLVDFSFAIDVADLSTGSAAAPEIVAPFDLEIVQLRSTVRVAISTGGTLTADVRSGTAVDGLTITVANSATKGTSQTDAPTAAHASTLVAKGERIQIVPQDAFNGGGALDVVLTVRPTGLRSGTLVTGLDKNTKATATNADVRGTYDPATACDGTTSFALLVMTPEISDIGNIQYAA